MKYFWQLNNSIAALYGAIVVVLAAVLMHVWNTSLTAEYTARVISALAIMAFHTLSLLAVGQHFSPAKLTKLVAVLWHLGLWLFVWTVLAGVFALPFYYSQLAPIGGQLLIVAWLLLIVSAWRRR
ncbi:MAG TPA: hypothetical protein VLA40_07940 [Rheinheimera sp.]|nr:hypothetical protein [Rheinheimera sp.]